MPKKWIRKQLPSRQGIQASRILAPIAHLLHDENLWHLNRKSVAMGCAVGVFVAFLPTPGQMPLAAAAALLARGNLAVAAASTWVTNPLTSPVILFFSYQVGLLLLPSVARSHKFELSFDWLMENLEPMLLGSLICGAAAAVASYFAIRLLWRLHIIQRMQARRRQRQNS